SISLSLSYDVDQPPGGPVTPLGLTELEQQLPRVLELHRLQLLQALHEPILSKNSIDVDS
ncbi:MAG: hypothetical protein ACREXR_09295, partial [Gammaproteobacteria bacterium]